MFKKKYLKYKFKYLHLKNILKGGSKPLELKIQNENSFSVCGISPYQIVLKLQKVTNAKLDPINNCWIIRNENYEKVKTILLTSGIKFNKINSLENRKRSRQDETQMLIQQPSNRSGVIPIVVEDEQPSNRSGVIPIVVEDEQPSNRSEGIPIEDDKKEESQQQSNRSGVIYIQIDDDTDDESQQPSNRSEGIPIEDDNKDESQQQSNRSGVIYIQIDDDTENESQKPSQRKRAKKLPIPQSPIWPSPKGPIGGPSPPKGPIGGPSPPKGPIGGPSPSSKIPTVLNRKEPAPSMENLNELSEFFRKDKLNFEKFRGTYAFTWGWLLYLQKELPDDLMCIWKSPNGHGGLQYSWRRTLNYQKGLIVNDFVIPKILECQEKRVRFITPILAMKVNGGHHVNALIFDTFNGTVTRFEPHGSETDVYDQNDLDEKLKSWLKNVPWINGKGKKWIYKPPINYCPKVGPQTKTSTVRFEKKKGKVFGREVRIEVGGYCAAWSLIFTHFRLMNPDKSNEEIVKHLLKDNATILNHRIREYVSFIVNTINPDWYVKEEKKKFKLGDFVKLTIDNKEYEGKIVKIFRKKFVVDIYPKYKTFEFVKVYPYQIEPLRDRSRQNFISSKINARNSASMGKI
jgi:hypothetical protein